MAEASWWLNANCYARSFAHAGGSVVKIFLSYSRDDADAAKVLANGLGERGHNVWWDKHISGGSRFAAEIEEALAAADVVIVLWSDAATRSAWVLDEAAEGRDTGRLLPVALDNCKPPLGFRQYQTIAVARPRPDESLDEIVKALARRRGAEQEPTAGQPGPAMAPGSAEACCAAARRLQEAGKFEEAQQQIDAALRADPGAWAPNREAARSLYMLGRTADAIAFCERAVALMKSDHESGALLVSCYRATADESGMKRAAEATVARAEQAIAGASSVAPAFASGARGLAALGHGERATKWLRKALNIDPADLPVRYAVASSFAAFLDDPATALDVLESFVERASNRVHLQLLEADPDWSSIRETREFRSLAARARKRVEALEATSLAGQSGLA
jgi:tetratricopeptide (TPR) repeat protein